MEMEMNLCLPSPWNTDPGFHPRDSTPGRFLFRLKDSYPSTVNLENTISLGMDGATIHVCINGNPKKKSTSFNPKAFTQPTPRQTHGYLATVNRGRITFIQKAPDDDLHSSAGHR